MLHGKHRSAIEGCNNPAVKGSELCSNPAHLHANVVKRVNPFIVLETYLNDPCTIRVDQVIAIVINKVHIDNHTIITLAAGEVDKLHHRIEEYYGGTISG